MWQKQQRLRNDLQQPAEATHEQTIPLLRCRPGSCHLRDCSRDRAISTASSTSNATGGSSAQPRAIERQEGSWPANSSIVGNWSGQLTQIGSQTPYKFELVIGPRGAETTYPDLDCTGKLTRVGASKSYAFFVEIIIKGAVDKGGRCPDGTITVTRAGNDLPLFWFGSIESNTIVAYGTLSKSSVEPDELASRCLRSALTGLPTTQTEVGSLRCMGWLRG